jgi:hypothetical protein
LNGDADDDSRMISRQQAADRVQKAYREGLAKDTPKGRASAAKRAAFASTIGAWLVRLVGGGGGN